MVPREPVLASRTLQFEPLFDTSIRLLMIGAPPSLEGRLQDRPISVSPAALAIRRAGDLGTEALGLATASGVSVGAGLGAAVELGMAVGNGVPGGLGVAVRTGVPVASGVGVPVGSDVGVGTGV